MHLDLGLGEGPCLFVKVLVRHLRNDVVFKRIETFLVTKYADGDLC